MKKENLICLLLMILGFIDYTIALKIENMIAKLILCIVGIVIFVISIIFERKAKNPEVQHFGILHSIIAKSKRNKDKDGN